MCISQGLNVVFGGLHIRTVIFLSRTLSPGALERPVQYYGLVTHRMRQGLIIAVKVDNHRRTQQSVSGRNPGKFLTKAKIQRI